MLEQTANPRQNRCIYNNKSILLVLCMLYCKSAHLTQYEIFYIYEEKNQSTLLHHHKQYLKAYETEK